MITVSRNPMDDLHRTKITTILLFYIARQKTITLSKNSYTPTLTPVTTTSKPILYTHVTYKKPSPKGFCKFAIIN